MSLDVNVSCSHGRLGNENISLPVSFLKLKKKIVECLGDFSSELLFWDTFVSLQNKALEF